MKNKLMFSLLISCLVLGSPSAFSKDGKENNKGCKLSGDYGYLYNGTAFTGVGPVPLTETGSFAVNMNGDFSGEGTLAFYFSNYGGGPVWLLMHEVQSNGTVTYDANMPCSGNIAYKTTVTVTKSSNEAVVPVGKVFINDADRSIAFTISGKNSEIVDLISTSTGTIASGTAHK